MTHSRFRGVVGFLVAGSMFITSTGAVAATSVPAAPQVSPWATLVGLTGGAPAVALCGSAAVAAAAQAPAPGCVLPVVDVTPPAAQAAPPPPIPVPPVEAPSAGFGISPLLLALAAVAAGVAIYFLVRHHHARSPG
jgi:hypothetical protein